MGPKDEEGGQESAARRKPLRHLQYGEVRLPRSSHPLTCPEDWTRKSMALYTNGRTDMQPLGPHSTLFQERPERLRGFKKVVKATLPPV